MAMGCWEAGLECLEPIMEQRLLYIVRILMSVLLMSSLQVMCGLCVRFVQQLLKSGLFNGRMVEER